MNILVANNQLDNIGGTDNYTYAIIVELVRLGHNVEYFTFLRGKIAARIEALGVKFKSKRAYDLIIANHTSTVGYLHKNGYIIQTCHGILPELEQPSPFADTYVSISYEVQEHLRSKNIESTLIYNSIDCNRFSPQNKIHDSLTSVLSLCQSEEANNFISDCCKEANVEFKKINKFIDNVWELEKYINNADLVVGIGRSLYDAMACGRTVISYDNRKYSKDFGDGYLTKDNLNQSLKYNCSGRGTKKTFTKETFIQELKKYDKADGEFMRNFALENLNIQVNINKYLKTKPLYKLKIIKTKKFILLAIRYLISKFKS